MSDPDLTDFRGLSTREMMYANYEAMELTFPGLVSQESIQRNGEWLPVPDSREWTR
jgi:hypothetical protein